MESSGTDKFSRFIVTSLALHAGLAIFVLVAPSLFAPKASEMWGSETGSAKVGLVGSLPGIDLPTPAVVHENVPPPTTKSLHPSEPAPKPQPKAEKVEEKAEVLIPSKSAPPKPRPTPAAPAATAATKTEVAAATNAIPTVGGGQAAIPYGQAGAGSGAPAFGDEAFGVKYGWYVTSMIRAIREKWNEGGGAGRTVPRVYVTFQVARDGKVSDVGLEQSSGSTALDAAALRAIQSAAMPALPRDYLKGSIDVRFYFDYVR